MHETNLRDFPLDYHQKIQTGFFYTHLLDTVVVSTCGGHPKEHRDPQSMKK
jgi:hypothetical protein